MVVCSGSTETQVPGVLLKMGSMSFKILTFTKRDSEINSPNILIIVI